MDDSLHQTTFPKLESLANDPPCMAEVFFKSMPKNAMNLDELLVMAKQYAQLLNGTAEPRNFNPHHEPRSQSKP